MPIAIPSASAPVITCYTKAAWANSWTEQPLLWCDQLVEQVAPAHPSATLRYRYGKAIMPEIGSRPADSSLTTVARGSLIGKYVKIDVTGLGIWYGIIVNTDDQRAGELSGAVPSGVENYTAMGLTWLLDQVPILQSKVKTAAGTWFIDRVIPFNGGTDGSSRSDRVAWANYDPTEKCFTDSALTALPPRWTAANAVEYIINNFNPVDAAGSVLVPFALDSTALSFLDYKIGLIDYDGATPWAVINALVDRRRGLGWHAFIDSGTVKLKIWSQTTTDITLPSGSVIPANPDTMTYDFDSAVNIKDAVVSTTIMARFDQVICRGERAGSIFTVRPQTNFEKDWATPEETLYNLAATGKTGYAALSDEDKQAANEDYRASDKNANVYCWWKLKDQWNGRAATEPVNNAAPFALPKIDSDGLLDTETRANIQRNGIRIQQFVPLRQGVDYTKPINPELSLADADTDFIAPMMFLKTPPIRTATTTDGGWVHCERLNQAAGANSAKRPYTYAVELLVRSEVPGLSLRVVGKPQHYIAQDKYVPNGSWENIAAGEGINHDQWLATVYMLQDSYARAQYPQQADLPSLDLVKPLLINVAGAHCDYLVPGTVVGVDAGELKKSAAGGFVRDDRPILRDLARMAFMWYGQERRILSLSFRGLSSGFSLGHLITTIGSGGNAQTINTCITSITYNLTAGTTSLVTSFGELDFQS